MASAAASQQGNYMALDRKLNSELKEKFQKLHETLAKENLLPVIDHLFAEGVISEAVEYKLRRMPNEREQSRELLSILHNSQHPLAFVKVNEAMMAEEAYKPILEQLDELKMDMVEPISGTAVSEHPSLPELNDYIRRIIPKMGGAEVFQLTAYLRSIGVDEVGDTRRLKENHLTGYAKPIHMEKLLEAIAAEQLMKPTSHSCSIPQNQTDEQQLAEPTTKTRILRVKELVPDQPTPTANNESKVQEHQQIGSIVNTNTRNRHSLSILLPRVVHTLPEAEFIFGVTSLDDELFVLRNKDTEQVEVYNTTTTTTTTTTKTTQEEEYRLVRRLSLPGVKSGVWDITSCKQYRCLYIADCRNCCVHRVELDGKVTKLPVNNKPHSLSVTSQFTVLVTCRGDRKLLELTTEGKQLRVITLQSDIGSPRHAIQLSNGQFVVCYGWCDPVVRVCIIDINGHVTQSYGGPPASATVGQLNWPCHLAVDKDEFIFVADNKNSRVLLLSPTLSFVREIVPRDQLKGKPWRLFLDVDGRRLYVAVDGRVVVVQL